MIPSGTLPWCDLVVLPLFEIPEIPICGKFFNRGYQGEHLIDSYHRQVVHDR